ncbi:hypothetical protein SLEP1_g57570 [Rubroshorea leprosula]|uniref:Uncharacterized protein n=1 Tax=Rubroshorea leprosula TaxID=152421 RepID=A0AAV5MLZ0_9ROSI|nr:hypothetical protein SLEP1_g57570 [Rubroshorea leprosula]
MTPLPTVTKALSLVLQDERQRNIQSLASPSYLEQHSESRCRKKPRNPNYQATSIKRDFSDSGFQRNSTEQHTASSRPQLVAATVDHGEISSAASSPFTQDQIKQLLSLIQPRVSTFSNPLVNMAGPADEEGDWFGK